MRKLQLGKYGLKENPIGQQCVLNWKGRQLLGDIIGANYNEVLCVIQLTVRHFNGELWPIEPTALAVDILE